MNKLNAVDNSTILDTPTTPTISNTSGAVNTFANLSLPEFLVKSLAGMGITTPTPVQAMAIPPALEGKNILASAQTGTGKTIAYLIPLLAKLSKMPQEKAIILTPTRELATQVHDAARKLLGRPSPINIALLIGGEAMPKQLMQLRKNPRVIIGTPGRINDILNRSLLNLSNTTFLVLDEVDRMLDMGFSEQLDDIVKHIPKERQTLMFSATMPTNIERLAQKYLDNPHRVSVGVENQPVAKIKQDIIYTSNSEKFNLLNKELESREGTVIIFVKTKHRADQLADTLQDNNHNARAIHGGLRQQKRERVIKDFRDRKSRIVVATDIAARGLDVPHIQHVINYDLPQCPEDYLHRIGRTGRAGAEGWALSLISPDEEGKWRAINRLINDHEFETTGFSRSSRQSSGAPKRDFGNRSPRGGASSRGFGGRKPYRSSNRDESGEGFRSSERPRRFSENSDRAQRNFSEHSERPRMTEGSEQPRRFGSGSGRFGNSERPRNFGENSERPRRFSENSDRPQRNFSEHSERPRMTEGSERPRRFGSGFGRFGNSERPRSFGENSERPRSFGGFGRSERPGGFGRSENGNRSNDFQSKSFSKNFHNKKQYISES